MNAFALKTTIFYNYSVQEWQCVLCSILEEKLKIKSCFRSCYYTNDKFFQLRCQMKI